MRASLRYILAVAGVERVLLYRTAKFWVMASLGVFFIVLFLVGTTLGTILDDSMPGEFLLTGTDAYLSIYFFSYVQAILIIFVAADFRKAEQKARLDLVMLSRPMTTANWVVGKYLGLVGGMVYLNLFLLVLASIGRVFKVIFTGAAFNVLPFLQYFLIAAVPAILFMTALVFFLVSLSRSTALAIILPLGYVAALLFHFHHRHLGLLDYGAFFAPLFHSDLIGFGEVAGVLWQRLFFTLLAVALVAFTILLYPRLEQSPGSRRMAQIVAALFLAAAAGVGALIGARAHARVQARQQDFASQAQWLPAPLCRVRHYDLDIRLVRGPAAVQVAAGLAVHNPNATPLTQLVFALNGGLQVSAVHDREGERLPFRHEHHVLAVELPRRPLAPGATDTLRLVYAGAIDAEAFMLDRLPASQGVIRRNEGPWIKGSLSAWLSRDFAVLPAQCGWYPVPGAAAGYSYEAPRPQNFATARLHVRTAPHLTVIAPGERQDERVAGGERETVFEITVPVPGFSLHAGTYRRLARQFAQAEVELYFYNKHLLDYELFAEVADTCYQAVDRMFDLFSQVTGTNYPYRTLALVEVPTHLQVFVTRHGVDNLLLQPGIVMIDEVILAGLRFAKEIEHKTKQARRRGQDDSPARVKRDVFIEKVLEVFLPSRYWRDGSLQSPLKNYLHFQCDLRDPVLARALELQLYEASERLVHDTFYPDRWAAALSANDRMRANESEWAIRSRYGVEIDSVLATLEHTPLARLRPLGDGDLYRAAVDFKAPPVVQMLRERAGEENYLAAWRQVLRDFRHRTVQAADLIATLQAHTPQDVSGFYHQWFEQATFPGYRVTRAEAERLDTGKMHIIHQVMVRVQNGEQGEGFVRVVCSTENDKIRRSLLLGSYEEKELRFAVNETPKSVEVWPYFSRNRGRIMKQITLSARIRRGQPEDTVFVTSTMSDSLSFILDDQDKGFFTPISEEARFLRPRSQGKTWWEDTNTFAYGKYYLGWRVKRGGRGDYPARWETAVPRDGDYELSFHLPIDKDWATRSLSRMFTLSITSSEGTHQVVLRPQETVDGWQPLGRHPFRRAQPAVVELSDAGSGWMVADAVRWEFVE